MTIKNQQHLFRSCVLSLALLTGSFSAQAMSQLNGAFSVPSIVLLAGMAAAKTTDENGDIEMEALGLSLAELFNLEVTIATGVKQSVAKAPSVTSVITAADIERMGATDLDDVLKMIPGLNIEYTPYNTRAIYNIRGIFSYVNAQVLVLINGIPMKTLAYSHKAQVWNGVLLNAINRIELIRGPGSAIYGADAFAGVINIITKTKEDINGTETGVRIGSFDSTEVWALHGGNYGGFDVALSMDYYSTDGYDAVIAVDSQTLADRRDGTHASYAPGPVNANKRSFDTYLDISKGHWQLRSGYQGRYDIGMGVGSTSALDPAGHFREERLYTDLIYHNPELTTHWDITAKLSYYHNRVESTDQTWYPPGAKGYPKGFINDTGVYDSHTRLNLSGFYTGFQKHNIRLGTGYHYADAYQVKQSTNIDPTTGLTLPSNARLNQADSPYTLLPEKNRYDWNVFIQDIWNFTPNWELTVGVRYDKYSDFGSTTNPRLALMWQAHTNLMTKLLYGSAFRAPGLADLYLNTPSFKGNPSVEPETVDTWELAFDYRATDHLNFTTNVFSYQWEDGIVYGPGETAGTFKVANLARQKGYGLEFETRWRMSKKINLLANYAFTKATNERSNTDAGNYPRHSAYLRTDWILYPNWNLNTQVTWVDERGRVFGDSRPPTEGYTTVDLTLRRKKIEGHWNFAVSVRNLLDAEVYSVSRSSLPNDLPLAGRHYWAELRYRF